MNARLVTAHLVSGLVHLLLIVPLGLLWDPDLPEQEPPEEAPREETVALVALAESRWEANRFTESERRAKADQRVERTRRRSRATKSRIPGQRHAEAAIARPPASELLPPSPRQHRPAETEPMIRRPAQLAHTLDHPPTYAKVAARPLPELIHRSRKRPVLKVRAPIPGLPRFRALTAAHPEMNEAHDTAVIFVLGEVDEIAPQRFALMPNEAVATPTPAPRSETRPETQPATPPRPATTSRDPTPGDPRETAFELGGGPPIEDVPEGAETLARAERNLLYAYLLRIRDAVQPLWMPIPIVRAALLRAPRSIRGDHLELQVHLQLDGEGQVRSVRLARTSGIPALDRHALEAVARAAPFLPPPSRLLDASGTLGFTYGARTTLGHGAGGP